MRSLVAAAAIVAAACGRSPAPQIAFSAPPAPTSIEVRGLPARDLRVLGGRRLSNAQWQEILRVEVDRAGGVPVAGSYQAQRGAVRFTPMYGFDRGRAYHVTFDAKKIPGINNRDKWRQMPLRRTLTLDAAGRTSEPSTIVRQIYPSGHVLPENMLRFYIEFSAPMGRGAALEHIRLMEVDGKQVVDPFLPVEAEFWNHERTRFTLFFDPGRVKRGIKPNRDLGRALVSGKRYVLLIRAAWLDGQARALKQEFQRLFTAGPAVERPLSPSHWKIDSPRVGTMHPVVVTFPHALDHGLLQRALAVRLGSDEVRGDIAIEREETRWTFTPSRPWQAGDYTLQVFTFLEDPAGNRIGRAFEVMRAPQNERESIAIPFRID